MWQIEIIYRQEERGFKVQSSLFKRCRGQGGGKGMSLLSGTELLQRPRTLLLPLLLGHPHVFLVGDLG